MSNWAWNPGKGQTKTGWTEKFHRKGAKAKARKMAPTDNPRTTVPSSTSKTHKVSTGDANARHPGTATHHTANGLNVEAIKAVDRVDRGMGRTHQQHRQELQRRNALARKLGMSKAERRNGGEARLIAYASQEVVSKPITGPILPCYANVPEKPSKDQQLAAYAGRGYLPLTNPNAALKAAEASARKAERDKHKADLEKQHMSGRGVSVADMDFLTPKADPDATTRFIVDGDNTLRDMARKAAVKQMAKNR